MAKKEENVQIEKQMERLEKIVELLSSTETTLNEGISLYEEGIAVAQGVMTELNSTKGKIVELNKKMNTLIETDFRGDDE